MKIDARIVSPPDPKAISFPAIAEWTDELGGLGNIVLFSSRTEGTQLTQRGNSPKAGWHSIHWIPIEDRRWRILAPGTVVAITVQADEKVDDWNPLDSRPSPK